MSNSRTIPVLAVAVGLILATLACGLGGGGAAVSEPKSPVASIDLGGGVTSVDVCAAIPREDMEAVMGRKLTGSPQAFTYYDTPGTSGCMFDGGKSSDGEAFFSYVVFTPVSVYGEQPLYENTDVSGLGQEAYFNNGADARQLWVKVDDNAAFVVAKGDVPNEAGLKALAQLILAAIRK